MASEVQLERGVIVIIGEENQEEVSEIVCSSDKDDIIYLKEGKEKELEPGELKDEVVLDDYFEDDSNVIYAEEHQIKAYWESSGNEMEYNEDDFEDEDSERVTCWESQFVETQIKKAKEYSCALCEFTTKNGHGHFIYHMKHNHSEFYSGSEEMYKCDQCNYKAKQRVHLKCHIESAHLGIEFSCDLCDFKTKWKNRLKTHKKSIHKEGGFPCPFCSYNAGERYVLSQHIKAVHENNRKDDRYSCDHCDYKAGQKSHIKAHVEAIHEQNFYVCDLCGFKTKWKNRLKTHTKAKHTNVFVYCDHCDFKTCEKFQLKKHIESKHGDIKFTCMACGHKVMSLLELKKHMDDVHADSI